MPLRWGDGGFCAYSIILMIYNVSSMVSLQHLKNLYGEIPRPPEYRTLLTRTRINSSGPQLRALETRVIKIEDWRIKELDDIF
jgi:hypothetical protein